MTHPLILFSLLILLVCGVLVIGALLTLNVAQISEQSIILSDHATLKHGIDAVYARQCADNPNAHLFINNQTGRKASVCLTDRGWGLFIYEEADNTIREITSFIRNKAKSFGDMIEYMKRAGYELIQ